MTSRSIRGKHCVKSVRIRSYSGQLRVSPYSVRMRENVDQNNSDYGHFLHSALERNGLTLPLRVFHEVRTKPNAGFGPANPIVR